jgi:D-psicose/D-tagatose/L-ribulose 3-epimerase
VKYGINTLLWTAGFDRQHFDLLPRFKEWGFDGVEIARFSFDGFPAEEAHKAAERAGLETVFCSALTGELSLISDDAEVRSAAIDFIRDGIRTAARVGAKVFVGPYCAPVGKLVGRRRTEEEWKRAVSGLRKVTKELEAYDITLALEPLNRFETYFLNTAADARLLCDEVGHPRIGILFDTFHANIEEKCVGGALRAVGPRLEHVHACENDRGIPGTGHVAYDELFDVLRLTDYDGWVVIESFGSRIPEIAAAACIWRDLAPTADLIAKDGVRFLRERARHAAA